MSVIPHINPNLCSQQERERERERERESDVLDTNWLFLLLFFSVSSQEQLFAWIL